MNIETLKEILWEKIKTSQPIKNTPGSPDAFLELGRSQGYIEIYELIIKSQEKAA